jgi:hypothetical protein
MVTTASEAQLWANFHRLHDGDKDLVIQVVREIKERDRAKAVRPGAGIGKEIDADLVCMN